VTHQQVKKQAFSSRPLEFFTWEHNQPYDDKRQTEKELTISIGDQLGSLPNLIASTAS
jgi:hypothetical protein